MLLKACVSSDNEDRKTMQLPVSREDPAIVASRLDQDIAAAKRRRLSPDSWIRPMVIVDALHVTVDGSFFNFLLSPQIVPNPATHPI